MPGEKEGQIDQVPDLSGVSSSIIEHQLLQATDYGQQSFEIAPGLTVDVDQLSAEFARRQRATSDFNRP